MTSVPLPEQNNVNDEPSDVAVRAPYMYRVLTNFLNLLNDDDRELLERYCGGLQQITEDYYLQAYQADLSKNIFNVPVFRRSRWNEIILSYGGERAVLQSVATQDTYDQRIYAIGKGPSALTVDSAEVGVPLGRSVVVTGTLSDVSPGTKDIALTTRFPNGVPVVADEIMSEWMLYVYKQFEKPAEIKGVNVKFEAIDPNGNYQSLGSTTTDMDGSFGFTFEPEVPGRYQIIATFEGSKAFYGSHDITYISADEESASTPIEPEQPASEGIISTEVTIIAAIAVVAIIGVVAFWFLRKV